MSEMTLEQARAMVAEEDKKNEFPQGSYLTSIGGEGATMVFGTYTSGFTRDRWVELTGEEVKQIKAIHAAALKRAGK